ncbi:MAG: ACT domain-containing protein, partial [Kiritimatiellae bacterium]|nr:ACT domain-containing protein [Kiritimatiellia bacterium]
MIRKQFTLYLENKPGALAAVTSELARHNVNIEGISVLTSADVGIVQLVTNSAVKTRRVLHDRHVAFTTQDVA